MRLRLDRTSRITQTDEVASAVAGRLTEASATKKLVGELLDLKPSTRSGKDLEEYRAREHDLVVSLINQFVESFLGVSTPPSEAELRRFERISKQSALKYVAGLIVDLFRNETSSASDQYFGNKIILLST